MTIEDRLSALEARLELLERKSGARAQIPKKSAKQCKADAALHKRKEQRICAMLVHFGIACCEQEGCPVSFTEVGAAVRGLQWHHIRSRSLGRDDSDANGILLCPRHHSEQEEPEAVSRRREEQMGMGKSDKLLPPRMKEEE